MVTPMPVEIDEHEVDIPSGPRTLRGILSVCRRPRRESSRSLTAAAVADSVPAINMSRGCSRRPVWPRSCSIC